MTSCVVSLSRKIYLESSLFLGGQYMTAQHPHKTNNTLQTIHNSLEELRAQGKRIVLCHGVFDLLHIGHIRYLRGAKGQGDILVVTVTPDRFVDKGPGHPAFNEQLRLEAIAALDCVDFAAINEWPTAEQTLRLLKPHVYAKGAEFKNLEDSTGKIGPEVAVAKEMGADIIFVEDIVFSSSNLINRYLSTFSEECQEYLHQFRQRYTVQEVLAHLDRFAGLKVLVLGDMIIDTYEYCSSLGASSKDPVLAVLHKAQEKFAGGAAAIANHVAQHVREVTLCTVLGDDGQEDFIRKALAPSVTMVPFVRPKAPTVCKHRVLDGYSFQKLIEIYSMETSPLPREQETGLLRHLETVIAQHDVVIAADFGHGCITPALIGFLCEKAPFLAVNTQANAGNRGYHTISRYPRADFISLAGHELTLEYRNHTISTGEMMEDLRHRLHCPTVLATEGRRGCAIMNPDGFHRAPSFASTVVDRVGAGDALFSVTALATQQHFPSDITAFLGNIAGSLAVETIGNAKAVGQSAMRKYITSVMK